MTFDESETVFFDDNYKGGHMIQIDQEPNDGYCNKFYIIVKAPDGSTLYDGSWGEFDNTLEQAIEEAECGSQI